jgi:hypothetical protein
MALCEGAIGALGDAGGVACRCVTLADWRPSDLPPPMRAAPASTLASTKAQTKNKGPKRFIVSPLIKLKLRCIST